MSVRSKRAIGYLLAQEIESAFAQPRHTLMRSRPSPLGQLSFDVISWLSEQAVPLIRIGWQGDAVSIIGGGGAAYDPERVDWQVQTRADPERRLRFCTDLIVEKLQASIATLRSAVADSPARAAAITTAEIAIDRLRNGAAQTIGQLLLIEARAAAAYFPAWRAIPFVGGG